MTLSPAWLTTLTLSLTTAAPAATSIWTFDGDGFWSQVSRWSAGAPDGPNDDATLDDGDAAVTITLDSDRAVGRLTVGADDTLLIEAGRTLELHGPELINDNIIALDPLAATPAVLRIAGADLLIDGTGTIELGDDSVNVLEAATPGNAITIGATQRIRGGNLGNNSGLGIINHGEIGDTDPNGPVDMIIEPGRDANVSGTFDLVNRGVIGRSYGTRELLRNADIDNTDGVLRSVNIGENVYLVGGIADFSVREDATGVILKDLDGWDEFASGNAGDTALVGTMHIGLTNRDDAILRIDPTGVTLAEGWIRNQGSIVNRTPFASSTLTIAEGTTVYGASSGPVGPTSTIGESDRLGVINRGMIRWDGDGLHSHPFAIDPGFDANVDGEWDFVNYGTVWGLGEAIEIRNADVRNYGEMRYEIVIRNCNVENSGSALGAGGGTNSIDFRDSTVYGGALRGYIDLIGNTRIENVHVEGIFSRVHLLGSGAHIAGSIVNDGEFYLTTPLGIAGGGVDVTGSGSFNLKRDALYNLNDLLPNVLTFGAEQHVHGQGSIGTGDSLGLIHYGTLDAESDGFVHVLTIDPGAAANVDGTIDVVNYGTMASTPDATLEIISGRFDNRGTVEARGGTVMIDTESVNFGGLTLAGGTWRADATDAPASLLIHGLVIETLNATAELRGAGAILASGGGATIQSTLRTIGANGALIVGPDHTFTPALDTITNAGRIAIADGSTLHAPAPSGGVQHVPGATLSFALSSTTSGRVIAEDTVHLAGTLELTADGDFAPAPGHSWEVITAGTITGHFDAIDTDLPVTVTVHADHVLVEWLGTPCPADLAPNGVVDFNDLIELLSDWGGSTNDLNDDGTVDFADLVELLSAWGACS